MRNRAEVHTSVCMLLWIACAELGSSSVHAVGVRRCESDLNDLDGARLARRVLHRTVIMRAMCGPRDVSRTTTWQSCNNAGAISNLLVSDKGMCPAGVIHVCMCVLNCGSHALHRSLQWTSDVVAYL